MSQLGGSEPEHEKPHGRDLRPGGFSTGDTTCTRPSWICAPRSVLTFPLWMPHGSCPHGGPAARAKVIEFNTVIASADFVTADALTVSLGEWYGRKFEPGQVKHIRQAHERGLGRMDIENLDVKKVSA